MTRPLPPRRIGPYPVDKKLDEGGFGEVFLAQQPNLGHRPVCIKRIHPHHVATDDAHFVAMFRREIDLVSKLNHANIVTVLDAGQDEHADHLPFVVMEYVKGTNAAQLLRTHRPLDPQHVAYIVVRVAQALGYAHQQAVIHRDVKPANILVSLAGEVKLTDFGISKIQQQGQYALTSTQSIAGTHAYMAPEQIAFLDAAEPELSSRYDHRVDLWALGVTAFELLCGFRPFDDESLSKPGSRPRDIWVMANIRSGVYRPVEVVRPDAPPALRDVIAGLLRPVDERIATAEEIERRLIDAGLGLPTHRTAFVKLFVKDTLPERPAYRPDDVETDDAEQRDHTPSTAAAKWSADEEAPKRLGAWSGDAAARPALPATTPMARLEPTTPGLPPASEPLPSTPERRPAPSAPRSGVRPFVIATIGLGALVGVGAGVFFGVADPLGLRAEAAPDVPAEDGTTANAAGLDTQLDATAPEPPTVAQGATLAEDAGTPTLPNAPVDPPAPEPREARPGSRRRAAPASPAPSPPPQPPQPAPRRMHLDPTDSDFGL